MTSANSRASSQVASEPCSDVDELGCQANMLYMDLPSKLTVLSQQPCGDLVCDKATLVVDDHLASRLPASDLTEGLSLCRTHRDIYQTLRSNQACVALQCNRLGVSGPEGKHYCGQHMGAAVVPAPEGPKVKFESDRDHPKAPAQGLHNIPDEVLKSLVSKLESEEGWTESDIANYLTDEYGGGPSEQCTESVQINVRSQFIL